MDNTWQEELDAYFLSVAKLVSSRSTCNKRRVGAVLVKDKMIVSTGYNGAPSKFEHCTVMGCMRDEMNIQNSEQYEICNGVHASQNAIIQAALHGRSTNGSTLYCTSKPCFVCSKIIANAGIDRVVVGKGGG